MQHQRGADHPDQEDVRVGGVGAAARREDPQHVVVEVDADLDQIGIAERVDPEGPVDLPADLARQRRSRAARRTAAGPVRGSGSGGSTEMVSPKVSAAMRVMSEKRASCG